MGTVADITTKRHPLVVVIVLNWNNERATSTCLHAIGFVDYDNFEIVVVDNGSENVSRCKLRDKWPAIKIICTERNLGFSGGCNVGIHYALAQSADYVWLLNNDTTPEPLSLQALVAVAESDGDIGAVGSVLRYMDNPSHIQAWGGGWINFITGRSGHYVKPVVPSKIAFLSGASLLIRTTAISDIGLLDDKAFFLYWEDADFCFRLRNHGWGLAVSGDAVVGHVESGTLGKSSALTAYYHAKSTAVFFRRYARFPILPIAFGFTMRLLKHSVLARFDIVHATIRGARDGARVPNQSVRRA